MDFDFSRDVSQNFLSAKFNLPEIWEKESEKWKYMAEVDNNDISDFSLYVFFSL